MVDATGLSSESQNAVLEMADVWLTLPDYASHGFAAELTVSSGELILIDADDGQHERVLIEAVCGLTAPARGSVLFQGRDWAGLPPDIANARRGRIGSATSRSAWLPYLSLLDNILLQQLHHTRSELADLRDEAAHLASRFGMLGLPVNLPGDYSDTQLRRAGLVRAFLGEPALVLIGAQQTGSAEPILTPLMNTIREARDRGAAVICFTLDSAFGRGESLPISASYAIHDGRLNREGTKP